MHVEDQHWWFKARRKYLKNLLTRLLNGKKNLKLCEIGCGTGGNLEMLSSFGTLDAVEMNDYARTMAEAKNLPCVRRVLSGYLPDGIELREKYDIVLALDVLEHVENDKGAVRTIKSLLKDEGYLVTTVPAYQWLWSRHDEVNMHFRRYTRQSYSNLLNSEGLNITYASYFNSLLFPTVALERLIEKAFKTNIDTSTNLGIPSAIINRALYIIFNTESLWAGRLSVPFGLSVVAIAKYDHSD